ncbi:Rabphilin-3A effector domain protein, partial [Teladorsagia circumcincta]
LKSGWSVRTATARSPTNSKGNSGITEAEQEHIRQVLAKAEASRLKEQQRLGLKSGWSVRTATARSPTNSKGNSGITEAEQEHIRQVLAKAEASRLKEQQRLGKMVDRLEKMRRRATGNGVTHCLLCHTEFGLLASKSYAAMCVDCRKYVCQRNCGVETLDTQRGEVIFLCKICSEAREVEN